MMMITRVTVATLMLGLAGCGQGTAAKPEAASGAARPVNLAEKPNLSADIEAFPRLSGDTPVIARINAELDRLDAAAVADARVVAGPNAVSVLPAARKPQAS